MDVDEKRTLRDRIADGLEGLLTLRPHPNSHAVDVVLDALGLEQVGWWDETVHMEHGIRSGPTISCLLFAEEPHFDRSVPVYRLAASGRVTDG